MRTAEEILNENHYFTDGSFFANHVKPNVLKAMEEYASQFKDKPVTELNERNSVDEGEKSSYRLKKCKSCGVEFRLAKAALAAIRRIEANFISVNNSVSGSLSAETKSLLLWMYQNGYRIEKIKEVIDASIQ